MLRKNVAGQFVYFAGINASTGAALTGATFSIRRSIDGTFAAGGATITEDTGLGFYKAALTQADTNGNDIGYFFTATSAVPVCITVLTTAADPSDTVRLGLTALPNAAAEAAGGLYTRGTGAGQIAQDANGNVRVNLDTIKTNPVVNAGTITFPTTATLASTTNITAGTVTTATNVTTVNGLAAGVITAASIAADAITDAKVAADVTIASVTGAVGSVTGNVGGNVLGSVASVAGLTFTVANQADVNVLSIDGVADAADRLQKVAQGNVFCTVGAASTTTSIVTSAMDPAAAVIDQFKGRIVTFKNDTTTANLRGQSTDITGSTALGVLTVTALTTAPASGDVFTIS